MIGFSLRLTVAGGREAVGRLVIIASAVALGVGLLLATLAGINAVNSQNARYAWLNSGSGVASAGNQPGATGAGATEAGVDPVWWRLRGDYFDTRLIGRIDVAATGPQSPVPPGIPRLPGPGEFYASPAMSTLLATLPADQLADRFPGHQVGIIGSAALPAPNTLLIIVGYRPDQLSGAPGATAVTSIRTIAPSNCNDCVVGIRADGMDLILSVVALAFLFPVLIFIGTATRLSAARREQRFAAMRLVGATPRQVTTIAAIESTVAAAFGTAVGFGLFYMFRGPLSAIPFTGAPFYPADLSLNALDIVLAGVGVPLGAAGSALLALRRVQVSPLGVSRQVTFRPPAAYRLIPLIAGIVELSYFIGRRPPTGTGQVEAFLPGFLLIMAGLVIAGPWLTMVSSRVLARRARRPASLFAARRLADNPTAAFRAVSGLMLALFVTSVAVAVITTINSHEDVVTSVSQDTLIQRMAVDDLTIAGVKTSATTVAPALVSELRAVRGVSGVIAVHVNPLVSRDYGFQYGGLPGLVSCADLAMAPDLGRCAPGALVATVDPNFAFMGYDYAAGPHTIWPAADISPADVARLPLTSVAVSTDGARSAIERARTILERGYADWLQVPPATEADFRADSTAVTNQWRQLANVVILTSLPIAGCTLAVSVIGGLAQRKRPFSLLRLTGVPLRVLRRVVALETVVPLLVVAVVAIGAGLISSNLFLGAQMGYGVGPLPTGYYLVVLAGLVMSLAIVAATFPVLEKITGPETARNE